MFKYFLCIILSVGSLTACIAKPSQSLAPNHRIYVLAGQNEQSETTLTIVNTDTWQVDKTVTLPHASATSFNRDPQGRIWIGFSGSLDYDDNRVQIYSSSGEFVRTVSPCRNPAGISFAVNRAFIACTEDGFSGNVAVIDLNTLDTLQIIRLSLPDKPYLLNASAADENTVVVSGMTSGAQETGYAVLTMINPHTLTIKTQLAPIENADFWRILVAHNQFYLLNVGGWRNPGVHDVIQVVDADKPVLKPRGLAAGALWGEITDNNILYTYHNPTHNQPNDDPHRQLSRMDLTTGKVTSWALPDQWNAGDLAIVNEKIVLSNWFGQSDSRDGLYIFDPQSGNLSQIIKIANADKIITMH